MLTTNDQAPISAVVMLWAANWFVCQGKGMPAISGEQDEWKEGEGATMTCYPSAFRLMFSDIPHGLNVAKRRIDLSHLTAVH